MSIEVVSTTDSTEAVKAANAPAETKPHSEPATDNKSASASETAQAAAPADETLEASEPSENESEESADSEEKESLNENDGNEKKPKSGFKKKIDKLIKRVSDKEQEIEYWKREALKKPNAQDHQQVKTENAQPIKAENDGKPDINSFEKYDDYLDALADWKIDQREKAAQTKQREEQVKAEHNKKVDAHWNRVKAFKESHDDFEELTQSVDDIPISFTVQQAILESDNGPELMYELAKNREEYQRINSLGAIAAAKEIGKIEDRLSKAKEPAKQVETKTTTKAPAPINPVGNKGSGATKKSIYDPDLSQKEFERLRAEQLKAREA